MRTLVARHKPFTPDLILPVARRKMSIVVYP